MPYKVGDLVVPIKKHYAYFQPGWNKGDSPLKISEVGNSVYYFERHNGKHVRPSYFYRVELYKSNEYKFKTKEQLIIDKINYLYSISKCPLEKKWITKHD